MVNDCTSDEKRHELTVLIPAVVGLTGDDLRIDARIALRASTAALPVVSADRQNALAVSVITADSLLAVLDGRPPGSLERQSREALDAAPQAAAWAYAFIRRAGIAYSGFRRHAAPHSVRIAVGGIAEACVSDPDTVLRTLLTQAIADCEALVQHSPTTREASRPAVPIRG